MTGKEFRAARLKLGLSIRRMGYALGLKGDVARAVRRIEAGGEEVSGPMEIAVHALLNAASKEVHDADSL